MSYNRAKGGKFHEITCAEWAAIALWCHKAGKEPYGNNNYGKDTRESLYRAIPTSKDSDKTGRVATGTGPITWSHDGTLEGIWDLNGNVWEWCAGLRLVKGEVQVIADNNAAAPTCDMSASSAASKNSTSSSARFFPESLLCLHFGTEPHPDSSEAYAARAFPYSPSPMTSFLNALPRSMKFANWSNAAHAGESVTMSPRTARS